MKLNEIIAKLTSMEAALVGSRYMNCSSIDSDWDYLMLDGGEIEIIGSKLNTIFPKVNQLVEMGFTQVINNAEDSDYYYKEGVVVFYRIYADDGQKVEVQITDSADVFEIIYKTFYEMKYNSTFKALLKPYRKFAYLFKLDEKFQHYNFELKLKKLSEESVHTAQFVVFEQLGKIWNNDNANLLNEINF